MSWRPRRDDPDVLYLVFEHMQQHLERTVELIAEFLGIDLDEALRATTLEHASLPFMQAHRDRFDDALMRAWSEAEVLPTGSDSTKVRASRVGHHGLADTTIAHIEALWQEHVTPATGFGTYQELIDSLH